MEFSVTRGANTETLKKIINGGGGADFNNPRRAHTDCADPHRVCPDFAAESQNACTPQ